MTVDRKPIWKAVLVAPLAAPLSITLAAAWESASLSGLAGLQDVPVAALFFFLFGVPISYGVMLILGLPYLVWLRSKGWLTWVPVCAGAVVLGSAAWSGYWQLSLRPPSLASTIPISALIGLVVGVAFCLVAGLTMRVRPLHIRFRPPLKTERVVSIRISEKGSGRTIGEVSEQDLEVLIGYMEEESSKDQDYYVESMAIDNLEGLGASNEFVALLRAAVGSSEGIDIVWSRV